uniref:Mechanosensitive ion channel MscS domain-containing protein n=1 Tax=Tetradesmus obliquus TaxID=3088 RepID=A0A383W8Y8_TETOB
MLVQPTRCQAAPLRRTPSFKTVLPFNNHGSATQGSFHGSWQARQLNTSSAAFLYHSRGRRTYRNIQPAATAAASAVATALAAAVAGAAGGSISCSLTKGPLSTWAAANGLAAEPRTAFLFEGMDQLLPLLLGGWLAVVCISAAADKTRKWCDAHADEPMAEVMGLLPAALENPTRFAVTSLAATRALRTLAGLVQQYVQQFTPNWVSPVDALAQGIAAALGPLDQMLLSLYVVLAVAVTTRVLTKWKTVAFELLLKHERGREQMSLDGYEAELNSSSSSSSVNGSSSGGVMQLAYGSSSGSSSSAGGAAGAVGVTGVITREGAGGMLTVEMRPRSPTAAAAAAMMQDDASGEADGCEEGIREAAGPVGGFAAAAAGNSAAGAAQGSRSSSSSSSRSGSSSRRQRSGKWFVGKSADDLERLLLPLDGVLSWVLVVVAGLLTAQALGINIKPLLAVGGASSIIIGLATQTLLSNAVTGLSIFLSRPFVAGDSITVQSTRHVIVSGTVERITPLRTLMRTDDDVLVTVPNKTISDMVIYNRSRRDARRRFKMRNMKERQMMKFKVRQPHKELHQLEELQDALRQQLRRPGVAQQNVEVALSKFSDVGAELLVRFLLLVAPASPEGQRLLLDLSLTARQYGATLVSIM